METPSRRSGLVFNIREFLFDRRARGRSPNTIKFYKQKLEAFAEYCASQGVFEVEGITPDLLRQFLVYLIDRGNNPGGRHGYYRSVKTFLRFVEAEETMPDEWRNPIRKVGPPKVPEQILDPVDMQTFDALLAACPRNTLQGKRDRAILMTLLETGMRAGELVSLNIEDVQLKTGKITIRRGKSGPRFAFIGRKTRAAIQAYLEHRHDKDGPLWLSRENGRLQYRSLFQIIEHLAERARVEAPSLHSFRRAFALRLHRSGVDNITLAGLMGHSSLVVLRRYLKLDGEDYRKGAIMGSLDNIVL